jgi:signal transduction histidine kinase
MHRPVVLELARMQAAKDDLVAMLVHDVRSPLAGAVAMLQLLREDLSGNPASDTAVSVKLVAPGHPGSVSVADRAGGGSVFRMTLGAA